MVELLRAAWVVTGVGPPIRDGVVAVDRGRIAWVGAAAEAEPSAAVRELGAVERLGL